MNKKASQSFSCVGPRTIPQPLHESNPIVGYVTVIMPLSGGSVLERNCILLLGMTQNSGSSTVLREEPSV